MNLALRWRTRDRNDLALTRLDTLCALFLLLLVAGFTLWLVQSPTIWIQEDGYYYFGIASHLAHGAGSTFDGVNLTNGYQPLWLFALVPLLAIARSPESTLQLAIVLQGACVALTLFFFYETAKRFFESSAALFATLLWFAFTIAESFKGLEFAFHGFGITLLAYFYLSKFSARLPTKPHPYFIFGIIASLTFLARLDTLALAVILGATLFVQLRATGAIRWRLLSAFIAPILITVIAYVTINLALFGTPLPISGLVKADWAEQIVLQDPITQTYGLLVSKTTNLLWIFDGFPSAYSLYMTIGTFGAAGLWLLAKFLPAQNTWRESLRHLLYPLAPFVVYSWFVFLLYALTLYENLSWSPWYYVMQAWLTALFAGWAFNALAHWLIQHLRIRAAVVLFILALTPLIAPLLYISTTESEQWSGYRYEPLLEAAMWARANLPTEAVIGAWNAGTIGFLSERRTVDLDGVVNSLDYFEHQRADLCSYWRAQGINYLVDVFQGNSALSVVPTYPAYAQCAAQLQPVWSDARKFVPWRVQVYRIQPQ